MNRTRLLKLAAQSAGAGALLMVRAVVLVARAVRP